MISRADLPVLLVYDVGWSWSLDEEIQKETSQLASAMQALGHPVELLSIESADMATPLYGYDPRAYIVLNQCESTPGISYSYVPMARVLETLSFTYTGSTPDTLELNESKSRTKQMLDRHNVPTPRWRLYASKKIGNWNIFPAIVKPNETHFSLGVTPESVVTTPKELRQRIEYVLDTFRQPALVEDFIDGKEYSVSLWGNGSIQMLPPAEIDFSVFSTAHDRIYTFDDKFIADSPYYEYVTLLPATLAECEYCALEQTAQAAYRAIGCRDYARLDIRLRDGVWYVLDVNANPNIGPDSSVAYASSLLGHSYGELGSRLVNLAAERHPVFRAGHSTG
jgi:D-alanine-D-alanine ligase